MFLSAAGGAACLWPCCWRDARSRCAESKQRFFCHRGRSQLGLRGVTCSSCKLSVVTASAQDFYLLYFTKGVFFGCYCPLSFPSDLQRSPALSPPKLCSSTDRTGHLACFQKQEEMSEELCILSVRRVRSWWWWGRFVLESSLLIVLSRLSCWLCDGPNDHHLAMQSTPSLGYRIPLGSGFH